MAQQTPPPQLAKAFRLHQAGQLADAATAYKAFLRSQPIHRTALNNLGALYVQSGDYAAAIDTLGVLVRLRPGDAIARGNLGYALVRLDRAAEAEPHLRQAIAANPAFAQAHNNLGIALAQLARPEEAAAAFARALELEPAYTDAAANLGDTWNNAGDGARAAAAFEAGMRAAPADARLRVGLALAHAMEGRLQDAREALERMTTELRNNADVWNTLGLVCYWDGQMTEAEAAYRKALALHAEPGDTNFGIAAALLARGAFDEGWPQLEHRPEGSFGESLRLPHLARWDGAPLDGTLLLHGEQGLGDVVQFCRYVPQVRERVRSVVLLLDLHWAALAPLLASLPGVDAIVTDAKALGSEPIAARASILSLPYLFRTTRATIPDRVPYLRAPPEKIAAWAEALRALPRPPKRVGLVWAVHARAGQAYVTRHKSVPFELAAALLDVPGISFVSLQKAEANAANAVGAAGGKLFDRTAELADFGDTSALIENLDLVITTDTSVAHVAGALAKPVWMLDRYNTCWRWRPSAIDSPWYPTMRIFRQPRFGDWESVIRDVAIELRRFAGEAAPHANGPR